MNGPYSAGTFDASQVPKGSIWESQYLKRGSTYRVTKPFLDADCDEHFVGEEWEFILSMFSRYDDELILCVRLRTGDEWKIPLIWKPEEHQQVIEGFLNYVRESESPH